MSELNKFPPNIGAICKAFELGDGAQIFFAYAPDIYNPSGVDMPRWIVEHERVHIARQGDNPAAWWDRYIADPEFRYDEELWAHVREYEYRRGGKDGRRMSQHALMEQTIARLLAPLYRYQLKTPAQARADIMERLNHGNT